MHPGGSHPLFDDVSVIPINIQDGDISEAPPFLSAERGGYELLGDIPGLLFGSFGTSVKMNCAPISRLRLVAPILPERDL
jgi:hypothetical protein